MNAKRAEYSRQLYHLRHQNNRNHRNYAIISYDNLHVTARRPVQYFYTSLSYVTNILFKPKKISLY